MREIDGYFNPRFNHCNSINKNIMRASNGYFNRRFNHCINPSYVECLKEKLNASKPSENVICC